MRVKPAWIIRKALLVTVPLLFSDALFAELDNRHIVQGELLIKFKPASQLNKMSMAVRQKTTARSQFTSLDVEHWKLSAADNVSDVIKQLQNDPAVDVVEPNYRRYPRAVHSAGYATAANARLDQINLRSLWQIPATRPDKVKIAVIDDAFDIDHPDLKSNIALSYDATNGSNDPRPKDCKDEFGNVVEDDFTKSTTEDHGTQVIGIVAAVKDNNTGLDGAADNASIYPVRISCLYTVAAELKAVDWAIQNDVDIISVSYGGPMYSELERRAFQKALNKEIVVVVAAGNFDIDNDRITDYPSGLDLPNILSVAGTDTQNNLVAWSQWGQTSVHIAAPGESFGSTYHASNNTEQYTTATGGTSFSAPLVAGVLASLMKRDPMYLTPGSVFRAKAALLSSAKPFPNQDKAMLATDGYADAMAAYKKMESLDPVILIKSLEVNDSRGNNNKEVDPGEKINLKIVLENQGADADNYEATLTAQSLGFNQKVSGNISGYNNTTQSYGVLETSFDNINFGTFTNQQNIHFKLEISGSYLFGTRTFTNTRYFTLDTGSLKNGVEIKNIIHKAEDHKDQLHFYHVDVARDSKNLVLTLSTSKTDNKVDLLTKFGALPQFDYERYPTYATQPDAIDHGVLVSTQSVSVGDKIEKKIEITSPKAGTYYIVVAVNPNTDQPDLDYSLKAEYSSSSVTVAAGGCSAGRNNPFDPILIGLCLIAFIRLLLTRVNPRN